MPPEKSAAKECFIAADRYLKESMFREARLEIEKAKKLDPSNAYVHAFLDRIAYFEEQKKKEAAAHRAPVEKPVAAPLGPSHTAPPQKLPIQQPVAPPKAEPSVQPPAPKIEPKAPPVPPPPAPQPASPTFSPPPPPSAPMESTLEEMKRQIEMLAHALEHEKKAREEMTKQQSQMKVQQFRNSLEKAWVNGAPKEKETEELHQLAISLDLSEDVELTVRREVKLKMYSQAVKEVIAKRQLLRSSSSTLEWLRKVYQVSKEEYFEYETKFLMDLVADQYKGTLFYVSSDPKTKSVLLPRLKTMGYAIVQTSSPEEALEKIEKVSPTLILCHTEFSAGSLSGIKFLHLLRVSSKFSFIPFILLCQPEEVSALQSSELRGHEGFVQLPVDVDELTAMMNEKLVYFRNYISSLA